MSDRLPLTVGFARVSQATEDQGNLETQTRQLQGYGVHELVTEIGSGARSDRRALRDLQARLHMGIPWWSCHTATPEWEKQWAAILVLMAKARERKV